MNAKREINKGLIEEKQEKAVNKIGTVIMVRLTKEAAQQSSAHFRVATKAAAALKKSAFNFQQIDFLTSFVIFNTRFGKRGMAELVKFAKSFEGEAVIGIKKVKIPKKINFSA